MDNHSIIAIIVDDEKLSREVIVNYLNENCKQVFIVAECNSVKSAYKAISELKPQLVFLDIEMPKGNGFDLLKMFRTIEFQVIFLTAYSQYAVEAFRFSAVDYLLKPIKISELIEAVDKAIRNLNHDKSFQNIQALFDNIYSPYNENKTLVIPNSKGYTVVKTSEIIMCMADGYCTNFSLTGNEKICSSRSLKFYEDLLPDYQFLRVHRSYIINIKHVKSFNFLGQIFLSEGITCNLSDGYKPSFHKILKSL